MPVTQDVLKLFVFFVSKLLYSTHFHTKRGFVYLVITADNANNNSINKIILIHLELQAHTFWKNNIYDTQTGMSYTTVLIEGNKMHS